MLAQQSVHVLFYQGGYMMQIQSAILSSIIHFLHVKLAICSHVPWQVETNWCLYDVTKCNQCIESVCGRIYCRKLF